MMIKVIGVGSFGGQVLQRMASERVAGIDLIAADADRRALDQLQVQTTLQIDAATTCGRARIDDEAVALAAQEEEIQHAMNDADAVLIVGGMGGGTGTRAATAVAKVARRMGKSPWPW